MHDLLQLILRIFLQQVQVVDGVFCLAEAVRRRDRRQVERAEMGAGLLLDVFALFGGVVFLAILPMFPFSAVAVPTRRFSVTLLSGRQFPDLIRVHRLVSCYILG